MILKILIALWVVFLVLIWVVLIKGITSTSTMFKFKNTGTEDVPYIVIDIQGTPMNMLIDTGAGLSVISSKVLDKLKYKPSGRKVCISCMEGSLEPDEAVTIPITIGNKDIDEDFAVYYGEDLANFEEMFGVTLHGILSSVVFEKAGCKIDYKKHVLIFP